MFIIRVLALLIAGSTATMAAERKSVDIDCTPKGKTFIYKCMIMVKGRKSGTPINGAEFNVGADMPSMPAAHNVKPSAAKATGKPGQYQTDLHLEMHGEWAVKLDFSKPDRDRVVKKMHFGDTKQKTDHSKHKHH